jgi:hypothetical protein
MRDFGLKIDYLHLEFRDLRIRLIEAGLFSASRKYNRAQYCQMRCFHLLTLL